MWHRVLRCGRLRRSAALVQDVTGHFGGVVDAVGAGFGVHVPDDAVQQFVDDS